MNTRPQPRGEDDPAAYELYRDDRPVARLEWRRHPRRATGWYLQTGSLPAVRLDVDPGIDVLARADLPAGDPAWKMDAHLAALLSTGLALDAERALRAPAEGKAALSPLPAGSSELHFAGVPAHVLRRCVPELHAVDAAGRCVLTGDLTAGAALTVARCVALLGGRVIAFVRLGPPAA